MTDPSFNIPSDFDYSILLSDNLPSDHSEIPPGEETPSRVLSESFSDDLDAIDRVVEERREYLTKKGVVIQHRVRDNRPVFRSSSLPPGESRRTRVHSFLTLHKILRPLGEI
jgi:hypothetical protein